MSLVALLLSKTRGGTYFKSTFLCEISVLYLLFKLCIYYKALINLVVALFLGRVILNRPIISNENSEKIHLKYSKPYKKHEFSSHNTY
jgi:hypothetical protein